MSRPVVIEVIAGSVLLVVVLLGRQVFWIVVHVLHNITIVGCGCLGVRPVGVR